MDKVDLIMERYLGEIFGLSQKERVGTVSR
jgi:hypothetical protein